MGYTVAYLGLPGSFSYEATKKYFKNECNFISKRSFKEIFEAISEGTYDYGIVPIENTTIGKIKPVNNLIKQFSVEIYDQIEIRVNLHLLVKANKKITKIKKIYSQDQAFAQCSGFLKQNPEIEQRVVSDTACAAELISQTNRANAAAIAGSLAAKIYKLEILKKNVQNKKNNQTTFIIVKRKTYGT